LASRLLNTRHQGEISGVTGAMNVTARHCTCGFEKVPINRNLGVEIRIELGRFRCLLFSELPSRGGLLHPDHERAQACPH